MNPEIARRHPRGLLDTNLLIINAAPERSRLPDEVLVSAISVAELAAGIHADIDPLVRSERVRTLQRVEGTFDPLPFDIHAARAFGQVSAAVRAIGRSPRSRIADQMIAAIAVAHQLPLYTTNAGDFAGLDGLLTVVAVPRP